MDRTREIQLVAEVGKELIKRDKREDAIKLVKLTAETMEENSIILPKSAFATTKKRINKILASVPRESEAHSILTSLVGTL